MFDEAPQKTEPPSIFIIDQECINKGKRGNSSYCMIALAVRKFGGEKVTVGNGIDFIYEGKRYWYELNGEERDKRNSFDIGLEVNPFTIISKPVLFKHAFGCR